MARSSGMEGGTLRPSIITQDTSLFISTAWRGCNTAQRHLHRLSGCRQRKEKDLSPVRVSQVNPSDTAQLRVHHD